MSSTVTRPPPPRPTPRPPAGPRTSPSATTWSARPPAPGLLARHRHAARERADGARRPAPREPEHDTPAHAARHPHRHTDRTAVRKHAHAPARHPAPRDE